MVARLLGVLLLVGGVVTVLRASHLCEWSHKLDRRWFGWDPPAAVRAYSMAATVGSGVLLVLAGLTYLVEGVAALPG